MDHTAEIKLDTLRPNDQGDKCRSVTLGRSRAATQIRSR
jgi:hypothetical protein